MSSDNTSNPAGNALSDTKITTDFSTMNMDDWPTDPDTDDTDSDKDEDPWDVHNVSAPPNELHKLTIGLRLQMLMFNEITYEDTRSQVPEQSKYKHEIRQALKEYRFQIGSETGQISVSDLDPPDTLRDIKPDSVLGDPKGWLVSVHYNQGLGSDQVLYKTNFEHWVEGLEMISPKMNYHGPTPLPNTGTGQPKSQHWHDELKAVLDVLSEIDQRPEHRIMFNESSAFHVYVGNDSGGISVEVARKLLYIVTAFERQFDSINSTKLVSGGGAIREKTEDLPGAKRSYDYISDPYLNQISEYYASYCQPTSTMFLSNLHKCRKHHPHVDQEKHLKAREDVEAWLHLIKQCRSARQLRSLSKNVPTNDNFECVTLDCSNIWDAEDLSGPHSSRRIRKHLVRKSVPTPTVRFLAYPQTLNLEEQTHWIKVVTSLVEYCYSHTEEEIFSLCISNWANYDFSFLDLLSKVSVPEATISFYDKVLNDDPSPFEIESDKLRERKEEE